MDMQDRTASTAVVPVAPVAGTTFSTEPIKDARDLAAAFLAGFRPATREAYRRDLTVWGEFLAGIGVEPLDARRVHVDLFVRQAEEAGIAPATIARRLSTMSGFYRYAEDEMLIERSPLRRVRRPHVSDESPRSAPDRDGVRALIAAAEASGPRDYALVVLLALTGMRVSEALGADIGDLGHERGHRTLSITRKGGRMQRMALPPRAAEAIDALIGDRDDGPIFATSTGRRLDRSAAGRTVSRLARVAGVPERVSPHSLRHSWVTVALDAGVPLHVVQDGAGHRSPATTRRYDRARYSLDRAASYSVASALAA
jgi:site-specific recombinase XerD